VRGLVPEEGGDNFVCGHFVGFKGVGGTAIGEGVDDSQVE